MKPVAGKTRLESIRRGFNLRERAYSLLLPALSVFYLSLMPMAATAQSESAWKINAKSEPQEEQDSVSKESSSPDTPLLESVLTDSDVAKPLANKEPLANEEPSADAAFSVDVNNSDEKLELPESSVTERNELSMSEVETDSAKDDEPLAEIADNEEGDEAEPVNLSGRSTSENRISILPTLNPLPQVDLDTDVLEGLERQFNQILLIEENEDAFSPLLGEAYLGYGQSLSKVGRLDEARDALANALHLARVNNGVYAIEQRPVLRVIFEMHFAKGELKEAETTLKQIVWLEKKRPEDRDPYSYDMIVRLGNMYIDQYYSNPKITQENLAIVEKGIKYLSYAVNRYGEIPLDEKLMPYGELALLYFVKSSISRELEKAFKDNQRHRPMADLDRSDSVPSRRNYLKRAESHLNKYYEKAVAERRLDHQVRALRDLGDLNLLFARPKAASDYYSRAWLRAAELGENHELVKSFEQPARLPDFNYAGQRDSYGYRDRFIKVPLSFSLNQFGRVDKVFTARGEGPYPKLIPRATRVSKRMMFRPPIENGKMIPTADFEYDVSVALRYGEKRPEEEDS